jgi:hypothetical protein
MGEVYDAARILQDRKLAATGEPAPAATSFDEIRPAFVGLDLDFDEARRVGHEIACALAVAVIAGPGATVELCPPLAGMWLDGLATGILVGQRRQADADRARRELARRAFEEHMVRRRGGGGWSA